MFDYIRSRYEENRRDEERVAIVQPADEGIRINYAAAILLVFFYVCFISLIVYGAVHLKDCPAENMLAISYIVIGSLGLLIKIVSCPHEVQEIFGIQDVRKNKVLLCISVLLAIILLGWFFAMCYWSFKIDPDTKAEDHDKPNYCLLEFYRNSYWGSIVFLTLFTVMILCSCGVACCAASET